MNPLTQARTDVAAALVDVLHEWPYSPSVQVFDYIPENLAGPALIVMPGRTTPYVIPGVVMGEYEIALTIRLFVAAGTNEVVTKALDDLIVSVCTALQQFGVWEVKEPGVDRESYSQPYLVTDIAIKTNYKEDN